MMQLGIHYIPVAQAVFEVGPLPAADCALTLFVATSAGLVTSPTETRTAPVLGPLYRQVVFIDELLAAEDEIAFNAGNHVDAISMRFADFNNAIVRPVIGRFARPGTH